MNYSSRLRGTVTQTLVKTLLEDAGYRIVPLGIEEVVREVKLLGEKEYQGLRLPTVLRHLPDFLVTDAAMKESWLVEVKYRNGWDKIAKSKLATGLKRQIKSWGPVNVLILLGEPHDQRPDPAALLRIPKLELENDELVFLPWEPNGKPATAKKMWIEADWQEFPRLQQVFPRVTQQWEAQTLRKTAMVLGSLPSLDSVARPSPLKSVATSHNTVVRRQ